MIKLSQPVVKEVFNRLLGINAAHKCPITPAELLVALHQIDPATCDLKTVIAGTPNAPPISYLYTFFSLFYFYLLLTIQNNSHIALLCREANIHTGDTGDRDAAAHRRHAHSNLVHANCHTVGDHVS